MIGNELRKRPRSRKEISGIQVRENKKKKYREVQKKNIRTCKRDTHRRRRQIAGNERYETVWKTVIFEQLASDLDDALMLDASNGSDYEFICILWNSGYNTWFNGF